MRILIVNEKLIQGGTEIYVLNLKEILEKDNEVYLLTFDDNFKNNIKKIENNKNIINIEINNRIGKINKILFNPFLYKRIREQVKKINPDKVIINNTFYSPITQIKALKGYELYQIVHDYSIVCPKSTCLKDNMHICEGFATEKCYKECKYHNSKISLILKLRLTKKIEKVKKKYIKKFISPSEQLNKYILKYNYDSICINNPLKYVQKGYIEKDKKNKKIIYVGAINDNKGIFKFIEAFNSFSLEKDIKLEIIGKPSTENDRKKLENLIKNNTKIINVGFIPNDEVLKKISEANYMVVPSLWMENYPTTVLEAMMMKTVVLGSNRGGIPEMLNNNRGITFDIMDKENMLQALNRIYNLSEEEYNEMVDNAYNYVKENNSFKNYYERIRKQLEI